jgi:hypothetical protein
MMDKQEAVEEVAASEEPKKLTEAMEQRAARWDALSDGTTLLPKSVAALVREWIDDVKLLEALLDGLQEDYEAMVAEYSESELAGLREKCEAQEKEIADLKCTVSDINDACADLAGGNRAYRWVLERCLPCLDEPE